MPMRMSSQVPWFFSSHPAKSSQRGSLFTEILLSQLYMGQHKFCKVVTELKQTLFDFRTSSAWNNFLLVINIFIFFYLQSSSLQQAVIWKVISEWKNHLLPGLSALLPKAHTPSWYIKAIYKRSLDGIPVVQGVNLEDFFQEWLLRQLFSRRVPHIKLPIMFLWPKTSYILRLEPILSLVVATLLDFG